MMARGELTQGLASHYKSYFILVQWEATEELNQGVK